MSLSPNVAKALSVFKHATENVDFNTEIDSKLMRITYNNISNDLDLDNDEKIEFAEILKKEYNLEGLYEMYQSKLKRMNQLAEQIAQIQSDITALKEKKNYEVYVTDGKQTKLVVVEAFNIDHAKSLVKGNIVDIIETNNVVGAKR